MKSLAKLPVKGGKGLKEASATDATMQAQDPLIPERRTKLSGKDMQTVPRLGVGDEAEAGAKNRCVWGAGKQKGTTLEVVRSPKPHFQSIAKNKVGVEQQKEIVEPSKVPPPIEKNKAKKQQGAEIQKETAGSSKDPRMPKTKSKKKPGSEKPTEIAMFLEVVGFQIIHENSTGEKKQGPKKGKIPLLIEFSRMLLKEDRVAELPKQQAKKTKGKGLLVKPTEKVQVPKEVKKPKGKNISAAPNLSKASKQQVKRKLPLQAATLGSLSKRAKVEALVSLRVWIHCCHPSHTAEDSLDQLEEYEKRGPAKQIVKVKKGEKASDIVKIYDSGDKEEVHKDREEAEDEGEKKESGEEEEKSIYEEGEEEEDEGGDEEGVDDEEEGGEKAKEEGTKSDEDNEDGNWGKGTICVSGKKGERMVFDMTTKKALELEDMSEDDESEVTGEDSFEDSESSTTSSSSDEGKVSFLLLD
ncbi:hypothetical protein L7F22_013737 [Adiantum nelumboides]|nr:hypothetical protein [Adiantum nelumboides]